MESHRVDKLINILEELKKSVGKKAAKKLELDKSKRIVQRLSSFSNECEECYRLFNDFEKHILHLMEQKDSLEKSDYNYHKQKIGDISSHLLKQHNLVEREHYLDIYMPVCTGLGLLLGVFMLDSIALGLALGLSLGVAIGASLDEDAKKKGRTL